MENKIQLIVPQFHTITRSATRKINLANHVPNLSYESVDFFASHGVSVPLEEATPERIKQEGDRLQLLCNEEVDRVAKEYIEGLKRQSGLPSQPTGRDLEGIKHFVEDLNNVSTKTGLEKIKESIKKDKANLNEVQLEFLRSLTRKAEARI